MKSFCISLFVILFAHNIYAAELDTFEIAKESFEQKLYPTASRLFKSFLDFYPKSKYKDAAYLYIAKAAFQSALYEETDKYLAKISNIESSAQEISLLWGDTKSELNDLKQAEIKYKYVRSEEFPKNKFYYEAGLRIAYLKIRSADSELAVKLFSEVIEHSDDRELKTKSYVGLSKLYYHLYDNDELLEVLNRWERDLDTLEETALRNFYRAQHLLREGNEFDAYLLLKQALNYVTDVDLRDEVFYELAILETNQKKRELNLNSIKNSALRDLWVIANSELVDFDLAKKIYLCNVFLQNYDNLDFVDEINLYLAEFLYEDGRTNDSIAKFNKYLDKKDKQYDVELHYRASYGLGLAYLKKKNYGLAFKVFEKLKRNDVLPELRSALMLAATQRYEDEGRYDEALQIYNELLAQANASSYYDYVTLKMAYVQSQIGDYSQAIKLLEELDQKYGDHTYKEESMYYRSVAYFELQEYELADEYISSFKELFGNSEFLFDLSKLQIRTKAYIESIDDESLSGFYQEIIDSVSTNDQEDEIVFEMAVAYILRNNLDKSLEFLNRLLANPESKLRETVLYYLASVYYQKGDLDSTVTKYTELLNDYGNGQYAMNVRYDLAKIYIYLKEYSKAESLLFKNIRLRDENIILKSSLLLKDMFIAQLRFTSAHQLFDQLSLRFPHKSSFCLDNKLDVAFQQGDWKKVDIIGREILTVGSMTDTVLYKLAFANEKLSKFSEAITFYNDLVFTSAASKEYIIKAYLQLAKLYEKQGEIDKSISFYTRLVDLGEDVSEYAREQISRMKKN